VILLHSRRAVRQLADRHPTGYSDPAGLRHAFWRTISCSPAREVPKQVRHDGF